MCRQVARIPGAEFIVLPEAHSINWERPDAFNPKFWSSIRKY